MKTNYPDSLTIQQYLEGKLDPEVMHQLEKQALDDPFLWDALEGYATHIKAAHDLSILQRQLHERIVHFQENKKVFDLTWQRLSIAAAAAVLFITAGILFWMNSPRPSEQLATNPKQVEVALTTPDSLSSLTSANAVISAKKPVTVPDGQPRTAAKVSGKSSSSEIRTDPPASLPAEKEKIGADNSVSRESGLPPAITRAAADKAAQPSGGWDLYNQYLKMNLQKPSNEPLLSGPVLLSLDVNKNGMVSNIQVVKGLTKAYNAEAIRLVKEGPVWQGSSDGTIQQVRVEVLF